MSGKTHVRPPKPHSLYMIAVSEVWSCITKNTSIDRRIFIFMLDGNKHDDYHGGMKEVIRNIVSELRTKAGVTQEDFAEAVGVTRQTVSAIERGNYTPSVLLALKIATFFKKPVEAIFFISYEK